MGMNRTMVAKFMARGAEKRLALSNVRVQPQNAAERSVSKSPTRLTRVPSDMGQGFVQRAISTFLFPADGDYLPVIGHEWTITENDLDPDEVGQRWRCFERHGSYVGSEIRCVCYRLD